MNKDTVFFKSYCTSKMNSVCTIESLFSCRLL